MNSKDLKYWLIEHFDFFKENPVTVMIEGNYYKINFDLSDNRIVELQGDLEGDWLNHIKRDLNKYF